MGLQERDMEMIEFLDNQVKNLKYLKKLKLKQMKLKEKASSQDLHNTQRQRDKVITDIASINIDIEKEKQLIKKDFIGSVLDVSLDQQTYHLGSFQVYK